MTTLIITNGDAAGDRLKSLFPDDLVVPWHDVLHEGPVPGTDSWEALSDIREQYLNSAFLSPPANAHSKIKSRDAELSRHGDFERVEFWFEHDLYDQLQLLQAIDYFNSVGRTNGLYLVQASDYLGHQDESALKALGDTPTLVGDATIQKASHIWTAFRQPNPSIWAEMQLGEFPDLYHLKSAMVRMLEELPEETGGLSRSERQILTHIDSGVSRPGALFGRCQASEEAMFMGDLSFFNVLEGLSNCHTPLVKGLSSKSYVAVRTDQDREQYLAAELMLTSAGSGVLSGALDHISANGIDRWWGGCHLTPENDWRWDNSNRIVVPPIAD